MAPVVRECQRRRMDFFVLHTGQHYSYSMDKVFFNDLELPGAEHNLEVGSGTHGVQTGKDPIWHGEGVHGRASECRSGTGDTNTVMALRCRRRSWASRWGHVEAGLRSFDRSMPEEINRIIADHISDYLFAPTEASRRYLADEGITNGVFVTGNTIVDAVFPRPRTLPPEDPTF